MTESFESLVQRFEAAEGAVLPRRRPSPPLLTAIGSVAPRALQSPLLLEHFTQCGLQPTNVGPCAALEELSSRSDWSMALVLSPHKQAVGEICDVLTPGAAHSGAVDTALKNDSDGKVYGTNTNIYGAAHAIRFLMGDALPERVLIFGTGASARSCVIALRSLSPAIDIGVQGRDPAKASALATQFAVTIAEQLSSYKPDLVINATTVGETEDSTADFPVEDVLQAGTRFFDLNNRTSNLQQMALARGCVTTSGIIMQRAVNALRAHLATAPA